MRGGKRENAGRKRGWESGCKFVDTKTLRVPIAIAEEVSRIAHWLDAGGIVVCYPKLEPKAFNIACPQCKSTALHKDGFRRNQQAYHCKQCGKKFSESTGIKLLDSVPNGIELDT